MFKRFGLIAIALCAFAIAAGNAQAGTVYYPDDEYVVRPHRHQQQRRPVIVEEEYVPRHHHRDRDRDQRPWRRDYHQRRIVVEEYPPRRTCRFVTRLNIYGNPVRIENCR